MSQYRCNLVIPGFPKSGTSSFHEYLAQHPAICMSNPKEPHHFARSDRWARGAYAHDAIFSHASGGERYFGESSTTYCIWAEAANRIAANLDAPKVIILMRHPVERALSHYRWMYRLGLESRPLLEALRADGDSFHPDQSVKGNYRGYLAFSRFADHVPRWEALFPPEDLRLVFASDLADSPQTTLARVHEFLGLPRHALAKTEQINRTRDQQPLRVRRWAWMVRATVPRTLIGTLKRVPGMPELWSRASRPGIRQPPPITEVEREWLNHTLEAHVQFYEERRRAIGES